MKKIFYLLFLLPSIVFSQIQVSDIDYQLPRDDYMKKGFMKVGVEEYFIEQGEEGTKVYLVNEDQLEFLHELKFRPTDSKINTYFYSNEKSNSGLYHEGSILYEFYSDYVYLVDIISGELQEVIDLKQYQLRLHRDFYFGDNFFHFRVIGDGWSGYIRLDRNTGLLDTLVEDGVVADSKRYWTSTDGTTLNYLDLETNQSLVHPYQFSNIEYITSHVSDNNTRLLIKDEEGMHLLKNNDAIQSLNCDIPANSQFSYLSDSRLAYTTHTGLELIFSVIDLENCNEIYTQQYSDNSGSLSLYIFTDEQLFDEYFIFGFPNGWQGNGQFHLFDIAANEAVFIDIPIDIPYLNNSVRYGDNYYFLTSNHIHYIGSLPELYHLDLGTYQTERISNQNIYETVDIVIGEPQNDMELNVYYRMYETATLNQIDAQQQNLKQVEEFDLFKNFGIHYGIYADLWVDNKYFFTTSKAIFVMENDVTTKLVDIGLNAQLSSAYKQLGDYVYVLTKLDSAYYALKVDINDLSYSTILLPEVKNIYYKHATSENAIVNLNHSISFDNSAGFFDLASEEFTSFEDLGLPNGTPEFLSGNNILYQTTSSDGYDWYLVNTLTKDVILTEIESGTFPDPFPDGEGGFYLDGWYYGDDVSFMHIDSQGKLTTIYEDFKHHMFYGGNRFDGNVKSIAFDGPNEMIIISAKEGEVRKKTIPDNGLLYYQDYYWYESDQISFVEMYNGESYDTYSFTFESDPVNITPTGREDNLVLVLEEKLYAILIYKDDNHVLSFEKYDYTSGTLEQLSELETVRNGSVGLNSIKISDSKYLISIDDAVHGLEPWIYDMVTGEKQLLKDMRQGLGSSKISDFTKNPLNDEVYFSAIKKERDRQLFKLDQKLISTFDPIELSVGEIHIYPNPTTTHVCLGKDYNDVFLISIDGKFVSHTASYIREDQISTEGLPDGMYLIQARSKNNQLETGKFILER